MVTFVLGDSLGEELAQLLDLPVLPIRETVFPDGEIKPAFLNEAKGERGILLLQKKEKESINDYLIKFFLLARKAKELFSQVIGVMPYLPYARQDAVFAEGEPVSALYVAELIEKNLDMFITFNMHEHRKRIKELFRIPAYNLFLFHELAAHFQDFDPQQTIVLGPDRESKTFLDDFCQSWPATKMLLQKTRDNKTGEIEFIYQPTNFQDKDVIIVDDIISTGGTLLKAAQIAKQLNAKSLSFAVVHSLFGDQSLEILKGMEPKKIITTNTLANSQYKVDFVPSLANFLQTHLLNE